MCLPEKNRWKLSMREFFTGRMTFLSAIEPCRSTEEKKSLLVCLSLFTVLFYRLYLVLLLSLSLRFNGHFPGEPG